MCHNTTKETFRQPAICCCSCCLGIRVLALTLHTALDFQHLFYTTTTIWYNELRSFSSTTIRSTGVSFGDCGRLSSTWYSSLGSLANCVIKHLSQHHICIILYNIQYMCASCFWCVKSNSLMSVLLVAKCHRTYRASPPLFLYVAQQNKTNRIWSSRYTQHIHIPKMQQPTKHLFSWCTNKTLPAENRSH